MATHSAALAEAEQYIHMWHVCMKHAALSCWQGSPLLYIGEELVQLPKFLKR